MFCWHLLELCEGISVVFPLLLGYFGHVRARRSGFGGRTGVPRCIAKLLLLTAQRRQRWSADRWRRNGNSKSGSRLIQVSFDQEGPDGRVARKVGPAACLKS